jgi:hypothetical protein
LPEHARIGRSGGSIILFSLAQCLLHAGDLAGAEGRPRAEIRAQVEPVLGQIEVGETAYGVRSARRLLAAFG